MPNRPRITYLDSLRFVAASLVLGQHLFETQPGSDMMPFVRLGPGVAGVAMFFLISGFVIPMSGPKAERQSFDWRSFMVRRLFRIYPLFLAALALIAVLGISGVLPRWADMGRSSPLRWAANLLLVQDLVGARPFLGVSWTLIIELIWYGLFAFSLIAWRERAAQWLDWLVPAVLLALTLASLAHGSRIPLGRPTMVYAAVIGFKCYRYVAGGIPGRELGHSLLRFCLITALASYVAFGHFRHPNITLAQDLGPWALALAIFLTVVLVRRVREAHWLNEGPAPILGAVSYSIYLLHPIVISATDRYIVNRWRDPVVIGGTLLLALASFRLIEQPGVAAGRRLVARWFPQKPGASVMPAAVAPSR